MPPPACHVAVVPLVAVSTWPDVGAVAPLTTTVVVAEFRAFAVAAVPAVVALPAVRVCHVAVVPEVAVRTWPLLGAVAADTFTVVVAEFSAFAVAAVPAVAALPLVFAALFGMSPDCSALHAGACAVPPEPCEVRNSLVLEVFPASLAAAGVEFSNRMSPRVVIGDRLPNPAVAVVPPVPPPLTGITGRSVVATVPHAGALAVPPDPVEVRNFLVEAVFPASLAGMSPPASKIMSPPVVSTDVRPKLQVATVPDDAVRTCPAVGAVAPLTITVVVAEFSAFAVAAVPAVAALPAVTVCHVAAVPLVAVSTWPDVGAVAPLTTTVVVAEFRAFAVAAVPAVVALPTACQVAAVPLVAVRTCPDVGAVAPATYTPVVRDASVVAVPELPPPEVETELSHPAVTTW